VAIEVTISRVVQETVDAVPIRAANDLAADNRDRHAGAAKRSEDPATLCAVLDVDVRVGNSILRQHFAQAHAVSERHERRCQQ